MEKCERYKSCFGGGGLFVCFIGLFGFFKEERRKIEKKIRDVQSIKEGHCMLAENNGFA